MGCVSLGSQEVFHLIELAGSNLRCLDFCEISSQGTWLPTEATEFAFFLKKFRPRRVGEHQ